MRLHPLGESLAASSPDYDAKCVFNALVSLDESPDSREMARYTVRAELDRARMSGTGSIDLDIVTSRPAEWPAAIIEQRLRDEEKVSRLLEGVDDAARKMILWQHAPAALTEGSWIQFAFCPARSHTNVSAILLRAHQEYVGYGNQSRHLGGQFLDALRALDITVPDVSTWSFASSPNIDPDAWRGPAFALALSEYPTHYLPELLGYNLYRAVYGLCPSVANAYLGLSKQQAASRYFDFHSSDTRSKWLAGLAVDAIDAYLEELRASSSDTQTTLERIKTGMNVGVLLGRHWLNMITALKDGDAFTARGRMLSLVRRKSIDAFGYHHHSRLRGKSVDDYLNPEAPQAEGLLDALAKSPYVRPGNSAASPLLTHLVRFGGPMFRIFTPTELEDIARWIDSLPAAAATEVQATVARDPVHDDQRLAHGPRAAKAGDGARFASRMSVSERLPLRELYHRLVNIEEYGDVLGAAHRFTSEWLMRSRAGLTGDDRRIPFLEYSHARLEQWLSDKHREQVESYSGDEGAPVPSQEDVIQQSVQLCPMVLVDGAWLQRFSSVALSGSHIGSLLYHVYADELGNGSVKENHPNVYRELMAQMKVDFPPFGSAAFAYWSGFDDESFKVPAFWLSISRFPREFLPELLGVNLAMELSGVGGTYRQGRDMLRHYGYSSAFVDLHNTIDNVSTGHTAMALRAVSVHLDEIAARGNREDVNREWLRVWTGYRALKPPSGLKSRVSLLGSVIAQSISGIAKRPIHAAREYRLAPYVRSSSEADNHVGAP
ncbi:iron-containing redox enzyme family protein [Burkholderia ubonensis]|uniref:iron-containing redox enzyme family protein n=1 Tax=Burkholderia ubonensis TaxID=101571 RepID=UPI00358F1B96